MHCPPPPRWGGWFWGQQRGRKRGEGGPPGGGGVRAGGPKALRSGVTPAFTLTLRLPSVPGSLHIASADWLSLCLGKEACWPSLRRKVGRTKRCLWKGLGWTEVSSCCVTFNFLFCLPDISVVWRGALVVLCCAPVYSCCDPLPFHCRFQFPQIL